MHVTETVHAVDERSLVVLEKRLTPRERGEREAQERLRAEATLLGMLGGRITPRLIAAGEDAHGPWLRVEKLPFGSLAERLRRERPDAAWVERAARAAFAALAELHDARDERGPLGVLHGDLSPANLLVDDDAARVVLVDLELALWRDGPPQDGAFRGTIAYAAPEVARGEALTARSDLFGLAATLLHAVTGEPPRRGPSLAALLTRAADEPLLDERVRALSVRGPGHAAIVSCLAHDPAARPASSREVLAHLR
jgi:eukaryotic-like serine/threonine-protein kinase